MNRILATLTAIALLSSCYEAEFHTTNHPEEAEVELNIIAPILPDGSTFTGDMTLIFDDESYTVEAGESFVLPELLDPGQYTLYIYSNHDDDDEASVDYDEESELLIATVPTVDSNGNIDPNPNEIYFGTETIEVMEDSITVIDAESFTLGRDLHFSLDLEGDAAYLLEGFSATLNGVAQQWDCVNDTPYGTSTSVLPPLSMVTKPIASAVATRSTESYHLEGTIHLLGVWGDETQTLSIVLSYSGDNPAVHTFESDVTDLLSDFNGDNSTAMTLTNSVETPTLSNPEGSIGNWEVVEDGVLVAK